MFCKKADDTRSSFEKKAGDRPDKTGQARSSLVFNRFKTIAKPFPSFFKALVISPITAPIVALAARKMAVTVTPFFLKMSFIFSRRDLLSSSPRSTSVWSRRSEINPLSHSCCAILSSASSLS